MSRLPLLDRGEIAPDDLDVFGAGMNLHRTSLHSPRLARLSRQVGLYFRKESRLDPKLVELGILQVAYLTRSAYEYSHHLKIGIEAGLSEPQIRSLAHSQIEQETSLSAEMLTVLRAAREMTQTGAVSDATFSALAPLAPDQIVDLIFVLSFYIGFVRFTGSLKIDVEPEYQPYLDAYPLPEPSR